MAITLRELIDTLEDLDEQARRFPTIIGDVKILVSSGPWSATVQGVSLFPNTGSVIIQVG